MYVALGLRVGGGDALAQCLDQRDGGVTCRGDGLGQRRVIVEFGLAGSLDGRHDSSGDQPHACLGPRQGGLEVEHALHPTSVAEDRAHGRRGEVGIEELVTHEQWVPEEMGARPSVASMSAYGAHGAPYEARHTPNRRVRHAHQ